MGLPNNIQESWIIIWEPKFRQNPNRLKITFLFKIQKKILYIFNILKSHINILKCPWNYISHAIFLICVVYNINMFSSLQNQYQPTN